LQYVRDPAASAQIPDGQMKTGLCKICQHPERVRAELLLAGGASVRSVSQKFGVNREGLRRHYALHVSLEKKTALAFGPVQREHLASRLGEESEAIVDHLKAARAAIYQVLDAALEAGDRNGVAQLTGRLHENLRELARLTGQIANSPMIGNQTNIANIFVSPEFARLQCTLLEALRPYAAARAAVVQALRSMEAQPVPALPHAGHLIEAEAVDG
jgi:hypothetical protein